MHPAERPSRLRPGLSLLESGQKLMKRSELQYERPEPIAAFAFFKGLLLLASAVILLRLLHQDPAAAASRWLGLLHVNPRGPLVNTLLLQLRGIDDGRMLQIAAASFLYAALLLTEGAGLFLRKRWAQYLTLGATVALVPFEFHGFLEHSRSTQFAMIAANLAVLGYLVLWARKNPHFASAFSRSGGAEASS